MCSGGCSGNCTGSCVIDLTSLGQVGDTGSQGGYGGYSSEWNFSTTTTSGTTAGLIRFNSATYASVTTMYINKTNADSTDLSNFLASFSNSTYFGKIRVFKKSDSSKFWEGAITAVSAGASEYTLTVTYTLANSTFAASDAVVVTFTPNGLGAKPILFSATSPTGFTSATTGSWITLASTQFTIPAGLLATTGDYIEVIGKASSGTVTALGQYNGVRAIVNGTDSIGGVYGSYLIIGDEIFHNLDLVSVAADINIKIERYSDTVLLWTYTCLTHPANSAPIVDDFVESLVCNNLTSSTNTFAFQIYNDAGAVITASIFNVKAIKYLQ
jgi:hypothetical protein